jgi:signal peptidase I
VATDTEEAKKSSDDGVWETVKVIIQALLIALVIRMLFYQPFNIPSGSMIPTLRIGDYLFVNKLSYGYGPYSFNMSAQPFGIQLFKFGPMPFEGRIFFAAEPKRGDVVVFKLPSDNETDYIKRVIGLPGDRIKVTHGVVTINGKQIKRERMSDFVDEETAYAYPIARFRETLPNGVSYVTLDRSPNSLADNTGPFIVPEGHYFMMGDNRDNSKDSRDPGVGYVPYANLVGRASIIFYSHDDTARIWEFWRWPFAIRWSRLFNTVD